LYATQLLADIKQANLHNTFIKRLHYYISFYCLAKYDTKFAINYSIYFKL